MEFTNAMTEDHRPPTVSHFLLSTPTAVLGQRSKE